jgi:hypothetical protein
MGIENFGYASNIQINQSKLIICWLGCKQKNQLE